MSQSSVNACGGIVLCGGLSTRMGQDKAWLQFGSEVLLQRVVKVLSEVVSPIILVAAQGQSLPEVGAVRIVRDRQARRGPLEGLSSGLSALPRSSTCAYVTSCDAPLLCAPFVARMIALLDDSDAAVLYDSEYPHPLAAVYNRRVLDTVEEMLAQDELALRSLLQRLRVRQVSPQEVADVDPQLESLFNMNSQQDFRIALAKAGFT